MPLDIERIRTAQPQNQIHYFAALGSTMAEAAKLAAAGAPHGTVVLADEQTAGIGRMGRSWLSPPDVGIYTSIILRLPLSPANLPVAMLVLGLATAEAIESSAHLACDLRWPNDVLIRERKVAGILAQFIGSSVIAGIGINVNQDSLPQDLRTPATSLRVESGRTCAREPIVIALLASLESFCGMLAAEGTKSILRAFASASSYVLNRRVVIEENGGKGTTAGLDENGFLLVRSDSGRIQRIAAGGVRPDY
ncbi:MAG TPA: biotin--[acetyl-CoA-carboxylase] ligase [Bryobacteraceae bacterium]